MYFLAPKANFAHGMPQTKSMVWTPWILFVDEKGAVTGPVTHKATDTNVVTWATEVRDGSLRRVLVPGEDEVGQQEQQPPYSSYH